MRDQTKNLIVGKSRLCPLGPLGLVAPVRGWTGKRRGQPLWVFSFCASLPSTSLSGHCPQGDHHGGHREELQAALALIHPRNGTTAHSRYLRQGGHAVSAPGRGLGRAGAGISGRGECSLGGRGIRCERDGAQGFGRGFPGSVIPRSIHSTSGPSL